MNDVCATVGIEQLKYIDDIVNRHIENQLFYDKELKGIKGIKLIPKPSDTKSSSWIYTLHVEKRDFFITWMATQGVMTSRVHERNDKHTAFKDFKTKLPNVDKFNSSQVSIPVGWWVTEDDRKYIVEKIKEFSKKFL
jgi:perosamine synthetase